MKLNYKEWFKEFGQHIDSGNSEKLSASLLAVNFPQTAWSLSNKQQYKQVKVVKSRGLVILTSMVGRSIKIFSIKQLEKNGQSSIEKLNLPVFVKYFKHQVIEVCLDPGEKYAFFSLTDFGKEGLKDKIFCLNLVTFKRVFEIETKGQWSKYIAYHPDKLLAVSNWHSNDLSIIDIKNIQSPKLVQVIPCGISPRGIAFIPDGKLGIVTGFYSRNLTYLDYDSTNRKFFISKISEPFDYPNYSGNMRHVVIDKSKDFAFVSNLGRNLIHKVNLKEREIKESYPCGIHPNTIVLSEDGKYLAVSCRESNIACVLDANTGRIITIVNTGPAPTGLDFVKTKNNRYKLYVTNFEDDSVVCNRLILS